MVIRNEFFEIVHQSCMPKTSNDPRETVEEPAKSIVRHCTHVADTVFTDIFRISTSGTLTGDIKSLFLFQK